MKILVCVKQVIDPGSPLEINADGTGIVEGKNCAWRMNRFDEYALEEAVLLREKRAGVTIHALTVGPERSAAVVKKTLEKGAQHGIHLLTGRGDHEPPSFTAGCIAAYARGKGYDLILAGVMSEDDMHCAVGAGVAALLGIPCASSVLRTSLADAGDRIDVSIELEAGMSEEVRVTLPCVLTIQSGINRPRYPSLSNVLRAQEQALETIDAGLLAGVKTGEKIAGFGYPAAAQGGMILRGTREEQARQLLALLHEKSLL